MRIKRAHIRAAAAILCALVVVPVIGQFFVSLADEWGWYKNPSATVATMMAWISATTSSPWFHWLGGGAFGFTVGVWLDALLKRREDQPSARDHARGTDEYAYGLSLDGISGEINPAKPNLYMSWQLRITNRSGAPLRHQFEKARFTIDGMEIPAPIFLHLTQSYQQAHRLH